MLATQVSYWANKENARHNLVNEEQNLMDLQRKEREFALSIQNLNEVVRHNKASEAIGQTQAAASIKQAEAAMKQAKTAKAKAKADIKVAQANVELAKSRVAQTNASTLLTSAQTRKTKTETKKVRSETSLKKQESNLKKKESKYYLLTKVALPLVTSAAQTFASIKGASIKAQK